MSESSRPAFRPIPVPARPAILAAMAAVLCVLGACFDGGGTETGNAGVAGNVHDGGGTETGNTEVFLVSVRYGADGTESSVVRSTRTDAGGRFAFRDVEPGRYAVSAPGAGETPLSAVHPRLTVRKDETERVDFTVRPAVTLLGRVLPDSGQAVSAVRVCVPGLLRCVEPLPDSTYRIPDAPVGAYDLIFHTPRHAHYLAIQVEQHAAGAVHLRDVALKAAADADHVPYGFYDLGAVPAFSSLPMRYAANAAPAWYAGKDFDKVEYFLLTGPDGPAAWNGDYFTAWKYRLELFGDSLAGGPDLAAPLPGFPLPVRLDAPAFDFAQAKGDGSDLAVSDGQGRFLAHRIERWDSAAGKAEIWIRMDSLAAAVSGRRAMLHWGRAEAPPPLPAPGAVFGRGDGFIGAWHFGETGGDSAVHEALGRFPGRLRGTPPAGGISGLRGGEAVIGMGYRFGTSRNYVNVSRTADLDVSRTFTVAIWARLNPLDSAVKQILACKWAINRREWHFHVHGTRTLELELGDSLGIIQGAWRSAAPLADLQQWHHYAATFDNGAVKLYVDGAEVAGVLAPDIPGSRAGSIPKVVSRFDSDVIIGSNNIDRALDINGDLDEFWYSPDAKSADWIRMAYETQKPR